MDTTSNYEEINHERATSKRAALSHPKFGLAWSNRNAKEDVLLRNALLQGRFNAILESAAADGILGHYTLRKTSKYAANKEGEVRTSTEKRREFRAQLDLTKVKTATSHRTVQTGKSYLHKPSPNTRK